MKLRLNFLDDDHFQQRFLNFTNQKISSLLLFLFFLLFAFSAQVVSAKAQGSVGLVTFTAVSTDDQVTLTWQTASELDSIGFRLYRSEEDGTFVLIDEQIIPANGSPTLGAEYSFMDSGIFVEETAVYRLTEVQISGIEVELATTPVEISQTSQPLPITIPTNPQPPQPPISQPPNPPITQLPITHYQTPIRENNITINTQPANTIFVEEIDRRTAVNIVSGNQPIILYQDPTPEGDYPPPVEPTTVPEGYVPPPTATAIEQQLEGSGYVSPATATPPSIDASAESLDNSVTIIGEEATKEETSPQEVTSIAAGQGRLYLWAGFIFSLLIFGITIYATTLIFTRRTQ